VRYVLEGSVRKSGQRVRVTGQLIDAETGNHLRTASALGYEAVPFRVESAEQAIASTRQEKMAGLIFVSSPIFTADATRLAILVQATGLPAVFESRWIVEKGGLMSYGPDFSAVFRRAASLADRLLKGAK